MSTRSSIPLFASAAVAVVGFASYAPTACRTITWWDGSSYPLAAYTLGIAPAPGSLLLTLVGWLATRIIVVDAVAFQLNLVAAAIAATLAFVVTRIGIRLATPEGRLPGAIEAFASGVAGLGFAFAVTPWTYAVQFTPYGLSACFAAFILITALGWWRCADQPDATRRLFLLFLLIGLDFSVHRTNLLMLPAALAWVALRRPPRMGASVWGAMGAGLVLGFAFQLLLIPLALRDPAFNMENPNDLRRWWSYVSIGDKGGAFLIDLFPRRGDFVRVQLADWVSFLGRNLSAPLPGPLAFLPAAIACAGVVIAWRSAPRRTLGMLAFFLCSGLGAVLYFNRPASYFRTFDRHYLPSLVALAPFVAVTAAALLRRASRARGVARPALVAGVGGLLLLAPVCTWPASRRACDLGRTRYAETFARGLLEPLEANAILLTNGDNDTIPLWYMQQVEGVRRDVTIVNLPLANVGWWVAQLRRRAPRYERLLDAERELYALAITPARDSTVTVEVARDASIGVPASRLRPRPEMVTFALSGRLYAEDRVVLDLLRIDRWRRPLYLASTVTRDAHLTWIWPYARLDGLAWRVVPTTDPLVWDIDHALVQMTERVSYAGLADTTVVMDQDSRALLSNYVAAFFQIAHAQIEGGDPRACLATLRFMEEHLPLQRLRIPEDMIRPLRERAEAQLEVDRRSATSTSNPSR